MSSFKRLRIFFVALVFGVGISSALLLFPHLIPTIVQEDIDDRFVAWFATRPVTQREDIAVVLITPETLRKYAYQEPPDRALVAQLIRTIDAAGPRAIGLDMYFNGPTEAAKDEALLQAVREARSPIVLTALKENPLHSGAEFREQFIARADRPVGYADNYLDLDVPVRRISPVGQSAYTAGFPELFIEATGADLQHSASGMIDWLSTPLDGSDAFLTIRAEDLISADRQQHTPDLLRDKLVFVGATGVTGLYRTPLSVVSNERMPKAIIDAHIAAQVLDGRRIIELSPLVGFLINAALCTCFFLITYRYDLGRFACFMKGALAVAFLVLCGLIFGVLKIFLPIAPLATASAAGLVGGYFAGGAQRRWRLFGR